MNEVPQVIEEALNIVEDDYVEVVPDVALAEGGHYHHDFLHHIPEVLVQVDARE